MSCIKCEEFQDNINATIFYRWKNANIEMRGCKEHIVEIFDVLNRAQNPDKFKKEENQK